MEKKPFTVTITDHNKGEETTTDLTGFVMFGIEGKNEKSLNVMRALMGVNPQELLSILQEFENSEEVKESKFILSMLNAFTGEAEAAEKEEVK